MVRYSTNLLWSFGKWFKIIKLVDKRSSYHTNFRSYSVMRVNIPEQVPSQIEKKVGRLIL